MLQREHEERMSEIARRKEALRRSGGGGAGGVEGKAADGEGKEAESKHAEEGKWDDDGFALGDSEQKVPEDAPIWNALDFENAY